MTRIHVSLDAIFDTRLGLVVQENPAALDTLDIKAYKLRPKDDEHHIPVPQFAEKYSKRNKKTLLLSKQTELLYGLGKMAIELEKKKSFDPMVEDTHFVINFAPYDCSAEEMAILCEGIAAVLPDFCTVSSCHRSLENMTPSFIKDNVDAWYMYEFNQWLSIHAEELKSVRTPGLSIMTPKLYAGDIGEDSMFGEIELGLSQSFKLHYQPVSHFSIYIP